MKIKYPCGCEYRFSGRIVERDNGEFVIPDYVDDDGYDHELCDKHKEELTEKW